MQLDINDLYKLISESIQEVVRENFQYNLMEVFGDEEIQLELEDGKHVNIYVNIEKIYNNKYSMYKKIKNNYTLGVAYNICKLNFKDIKRFRRIEKK